MNISAEVLALLDPGTILTIQVRAGDLLVALQRKAGGPDELSTTQAAEFIGRTPKWWRQQCEAERIPGAYLDEVGKWRLPNAGARKYLATVSTGRAKSTPKISRTQSIRRGPRKQSTESPRLVALPVR